MACPQQWEMPQQPAQVFRLPAVGLGTGGLSWWRPGRGGPPRTRSRTLARPLLLDLVARKSFPVRQSSRQHGSTQYVIEVSFPRQDGVQVRLCCRTAKQQRDCQSRSVWQHAGLSALAGTLLVRCREVQERHSGTVVDENAQRSGERSLRWMPAVAGQICKLGAGTATCGVGNFGGLRGFREGPSESVRRGSASRSPGIRGSSVGDRRHAVSLPSTGLGRPRQVRAARLQA